MKTIIIFILISFIVNAQDEAILSKFPGKWKMDISNADKYEEWKRINNSELTGISYGLNNDERILFEDLYLKKFANQWAYVALPEGQAITLFALAGHTESMFIFENKEHDFPQRIIYEFENDGKLQVTIQGEIDGNPKKRIFSFIRESY